ncbi:MAG: serine/threonine protein kinase [Myxococcales bacterium]|nr:serine/threonine protein kinase [Myxococcales bacterium]MDD9971692.1 serine/threonine protein kinase [Myxococcales bacterium]
MQDRIGNCRILGEIGSGGMAVIYKAVQEPLERVVAIKALKPSIAVDSQFAMRFEREALFMASLQHENILHVYDFIKDGDTMYIIMEYVQGIDLYDLLQLTPQLPVEVAAIIALQVARALDYAHFRGLIHRDIKPANIMISHNGEVKLMDFGIARDHTLSDLTETGTGVGTPSYMSPEQILGDKLDFRSDIFSLGIVLYQSITGRKPFVEDEARSVMQKIRLDRYTNPRRLVASVPSGIERILARCMEKLPANRYPTTQVLIDDLVEFLSARVGINHNGRLVMYLRDVGVISESEANELLQAGSTRNLRGAQRDGQLVRSALFVFSVLALAVVVTGGAIQAADGRFRRDEDEYAQHEDGWLPNRVGYLQTVVDPWAEVFVDGESVMTTPHALPLPLSPGKHYLRLENPYYRQETREVIIRSGQIVELKVEMTPKHQPTAPVIKPKVTPRKAKDRRGDDKARAKASQRKSK